MAEREGGANAARYEAAVRRWFAFVRREPNALMTGSLLFCLTALPVVTIGPAWLALVRYMDHRDRGVALTYGEALRFAFRDARGKGWWMGLTDALALIMAGGCALAVLSEAAALPVRAAYAVLFMLDCAYLLSGIYRCAALSDEPETPVALLAARGFLMLLGNPGWTLLFGCVELLALILCACTGVGLVLLLPAAMALLGACAYKEMAKAYRKQDDEDLDEDD